MLRAIPQRYLEFFIAAVIFYSIGTHFIEIEFTDSEHSQGFWLWSERMVAAIFTVEYVVRWRASHSWLYPLRFMAVVDLLAILPFYVGFFVDLRSLRLIRTLRVLRLFKLYRQNNALTTLYSAFHRIRHEFAVIGFGVFVICWCSALAIHELERHEQPDKFGKISDSVWFTLVTVTTVGYGDRVPVTPGGKFVAGCTMVAGLTLFGTFISLVGGSFVEEIRKARSQPAPAIAELRAMTSENFDPARALAAIKRGDLRIADGNLHPEALRLLTVACELLK